MSTLWAVALCAACSACGAPGDDAATTDASVDAPTTCNGAGFGGGEATVHVAGATGTIMDTGVAVANQPVSITGIDLAITGQTNAAGAFSLAIEHDLKRPALVFGDGLAYPRLAVPIDQAQTSLTLNTLALPASGIPLRAGHPAMSGPVSLDIPAASTVSIDTLVYDTADKQQLRAVWLQAEEESLVLPAGMNFEVLIGLAPIDTTICPPATLTIPNGRGWPANAKVEVWALEDDVFQAWGPFGGWGKVADGVVSADADTITAPLPILKTLALRRKP
ncbi:MAG TPA: hypothetical protein VHE35_03145 [Kofleriaceae bacterium]|nr:hypothetical protein [Kofleriaceae bacterium]